MTERRVWIDDCGREHPLFDGLTIKRKWCRATALPDSPFCLTHDPRGNGQSARTNAIHEYLQPPTKP